MGNTTVTETACDLCGAEVRDGSLFCYNCGTAVPDPHVKSSADVPDPHVKSSADVPDPHVHSSTDGPVADKVAETNNRPPLRSAASLRQQRRASNRQPVEVSWVPKAQTPMLFVIGSVVLALGALVLLLIALYLR